MRIKRILLAVLLTLAMAPGTFVRSELPLRDWQSPIAIKALQVAPLKAGPLELEAAWELSSENFLAGGFSALAHRPDGSFLSVSDTGRLIAFPRPDKAILPIHLHPFLATDAQDKRDADLEALTVDPQTGTVWVALERSQSILRFGPGMEPRGSVYPPEMADWAKNAGPEAMTRLADGRFLLVEESAFDDGLHQALLFARDPVAGGRPIAFTFQARDGFRPSDAALLPDGRVAVFLRGVDWGYPPGFPGQIVIVDPARITEGGILESILLARIEAPLPSDNFEGMTVIDEGDGIWSLWLLSDDNFARFQRTLLLKFRWDTNARPTRKKARR